jgi:hypothetical protein
LATSATLSIGAAEGDGLPLPATDFSFLDFFSSRSGSDFSFFNVFLSSISDFPFLDDFCCCSIPSSFSTSAFFPFYLKVKSCFTGGFLAFLESSIFSISSCSFNTNSFSSVSTKMSENLYTYIAIPSSFSYLHLSPSICLGAPSF